MMSMPPTVEPATGTTGVKTLGTSVAPSLDSRGPRCDSSAPPGSGASGGVLNPPDQNLVNKNGVAGSWSQPA